MASPTDLPEALFSRTRHAMRRAFGYAFLFSFAVNLLSLLSPLYSMQVYDRVFTTRSVDTLIGLTSVILIGYAFYGALFAIRAGIIARVIEWLERTLAPQILHLSIEQAAQSGVPLAGQHQRDLMTIKNFIALAAPTVMDLPWSIIFLLVIYMINPLLGFMSLFGMGMLCVSAVLNEYATRKVLMRAQEHSVESALNADAIGRSSEAICAMGMNRAVVDHWLAHSVRGLTLQDAAQNRSALINALTRTLRLVLQIAVIAVGAWLALHQELSSGGLIACSILSQRVLMPFDQAVGVWKQLVAARESYARLDRLLKQPLPAGATVLPAPRGMLSVEGLYVNFGKGQPTLRNINFNLQPGESLGIIGPSAAGKSTLGKALCGVVNPSYGSVRLDGAEIFQWGRAEVGPYIGYLPQQVDLFPGTIKQNIARMQKDAPDVAVVEAAMKAGVHHLILQFEHGYDTQVAAGNLALSPGQRQRIGLARALYGAPRLMILDEPNSNLDGDGERALVHVIGELKKAGITTLVIAHRPSILSSVDKVMMLRGGTIEAFGPREEILGRFAANRRLPEKGGNA